MAVISAARRGDCLNGRYATISNNTPQIEHQNSNTGDGEKGAQHVDLAVSEVNKLNNTVDHGVTHRDHGVYAADDQAVDKLL